VHPYNIHFVIVCNWRYVAIDQFQKDSRHTSAAGAGSADQACQFQQLWHWEDLICLRTPEAQHHKAHSITIRQPWFQKSGHVIIVKTKHLPLALLSHIYGHFQFWQKKQGIKDMVWNTSSVQSNFNFATDFKIFKILSWVQILVI
jgi:hypothetical protein